ncbi:MAG: hypothetical protein Fur0040_07720 [Sideroxydans sp.]
MDIAKTPSLLRVLLVESSDEDAQRILDKLSTYGYRVESYRVQSEAALLEALATRPFDLLLCNDEPDCFGGLAALEALHATGLDLPLLLLARELKDERIIPALQRGAADYLYKGSLNRLLPSIEHALREARVRAEFRAAQRELIENQTRMHAFISDLPGMAYQIRLTADGHVSFPYVSEGCFALLGLEAQELVGDARLFETLLHPEDRADYLATLHRSAQELTFWNWEGRIRTGPNQEIKWINLRCSPRRLDGGVQWEGIMLNITHSKRLAAELQQSQAQLRELSAHLQDVREQERIAIAREVHDDLGSLLTATRLEVAWLISKLGDLPALQEKARAIEELVDKCTRSASTIARNLRPSALDTFGLAAAIENEIREFSQRTGIACQFQCSEEKIEAAPQVAISVFRILQEALANITKHARASQVQVALTNSPDCIDLVVRDNGCGIRDADRAKPHSFGLRGIFERVAHFGGDITLQSAPDQGTTLSVCIPHHAPNRPPTPTDIQQTLFI